MLVTEHDSLAVYMQMQRGCGVIPGGRQTEPRAQAYK